MPDITISLSGVAATRLKAALKETLNPKDAEGEPRPVTLEDAQAYIVKDLKQLIHTAETRVAIRAAKNASDPTIA